MTNIQAIDLLKDLEQSLDDYCELNDEGKTAFRMAITALEVFGLSEQLPSAQPEKRTEERTETHACDLIEKQELLTELDRYIDAHQGHGFENVRVILRGLKREIIDFPCAQPERDIPIKPAEVTETYLGRCVRAAVCPKCDYHLGRVYFLSDGHDIGVRKISYCETCGQAIDWSEWEDEE